MIKKTAIESIAVEEFGTYVQSVFIPWFRHPIPRSRPADYRFH